MSKLPIPGIDGHQTRVDFKKATLDKNLKWILELKMNDIPEVLGTVYEFYIVYKNDILDMKYEDLKDRNNIQIPGAESLEDLYELLKEGRAMHPDYHFKASIVEVKRGSSSTVKLRVTADIVKDFEEILNQGNLEEYVLILKQ